MNCTEQHAAWEKEAARVRQLAATLGPQAEACIDQQLAYDKRRAAWEADLKTHQQCTADAVAWKAQQKAYQEAQACRKLLDKKVEYGTYLSQVKAENAKRVRDWEERVAKIQAENDKIVAANMALGRAYGNKMQAWGVRNARRQEWVAGAQAQRDALEREFQSKISGSAVLKSFRWSYRTQRCNTTMRCMTKERKDALRSQCQPIRGLGGTKMATTCMYRSFYPTCPTSCPTYWPLPGPKPEEPKYTPTKKIPEKPALVTAKTWEEWSGGIDPRTLNCDPSAPNPGSRPVCTPPSGPEPTPPSCTVPEIPQVPPAPGCKPGFLEQIGPMWLLLAAGGAGLYWMARK